MKQTKGITLISLIITIIIMLILVAVTITAVINSGLIGKTKQTGEDYKTATEKEANLDVDLSKYVNGTGNEENTELEAGLYQTGTTTLIKSWEALKEAGEVVVTDGKLESISLSEQGDLVISKEVNELSEYYYEIDLGGGEVFQISTIQKVTGIYIPNTVSNIPEYAFLRC